MVLEIPLHAPCNLDVQTLPRDRMGEGGCSGSLAGVPILIEIIELLERQYPLRLAEEWDRVGLVVGDPARSVRRALFTVDVTDSTVEQACEWGADLIIAHHPLLLRGVHSVATTTAKGRLVHQLIRNNVALYVAHTNADKANPGVSDALARRLGLMELRPLVPVLGEPHETRGLGRVGHVPTPTRFGDFVTQAASSLPPTSVGVRGAGNPDLMVRTVAVSGGAGDSLLGVAKQVGADVFLTADLRHHPASEHLAERGPALIDAGHWATERPWLDEAATMLAAAVPSASPGEAALTTLVSDIVTDPWTVMAHPD